MADSATLDIITTSDRPTVKVNGVPYAVRQSNDLTLQDFRRLEQLAPRASSLLKQDTLTDGQNKELSAVLDALCRMALVAPQAVFADLGDMNKLLVFGVFMELSTPSLQRMRVFLGASPQAGTRSSRASNASTVATPSRGARRSRSAPSART